MPRKILRGWEGGGGLGAPDSSIFVSPPWGWSSFVCTAGIIHRDLKPENVLLNDSHTHIVGRSQFGVPGLGHRPQEQYPFIVKLCDFGLARYLPDANCSGGTDFTMTATVGTPAFMAPEVTSQTAQAQYNPKSDVYAFGMILWCMATGKTPYEDEGILNVFSLALQVAQGLRPALPEDSHFKSLIQKCWDTDPAARPSFTEIQVELQLAAPMTTSHGADRAATATSEEALAGDANLIATLRRRNDVLNRSKAATSSGTDSSPPGIERKKPNFQDDLLATLGATQAEVLCTRRDEVALPLGMHVYDWFSLHCSDFFFDASVLSNVVIPDTCSHASCFEMTAGPAFTWTAPGGRPVSAPEYISRMLNWVSLQLNDRNMFPPVDLDATLDRRMSTTDPAAVASSVLQDGTGKASPSLSGFEEEALQRREKIYCRNFEDKVRAIVRFIVRIYGHLYHSHAPDFIALGSSCV